MKNNMSNSAKDITNSVQDESLYWEKIPIWSGSNPKFEVMADDWSGRIPVIKIEHWRDFATLLESPFFNRSGIELVFRGHRRYDWSMTPTLGRLTENKIVTDKLADRQLSLFRQAVRGRINDNSLLENLEQNDELWAIGQHYGLMTPLLDWTYSPYVALFFAFTKEDQEDETKNHYRALYVLNKSFLEREELNSEIKLFEPKKDDHGRLVSQAGLFIFAPTDSTVENKLTNLLADPNFQEEELVNANDESEANILAKYICKIYIKNEDQQGCLRHLRKMNVHHASLFPDLIGASEYCNSLMLESKTISDLNDKISVDETEVESDDSIWNKAELEFLDRTKILAENAAEMYNPAEDNQQLFETLVNDLIYFIPKESRYKDSLHAKVYILIRLKLRLKRISKDEIEKVINLYREKMKTEFFIDQKVSAFGHNRAYYYGGTVPEDIYVESENGPVLFASAGEVILKNEPTLESSYTYAPLSEVKLIS
jgi:hypothetical protein